MNLAVNSPLISRQPAFGMTYAFLPFAASFFAAWDITRWQGRSQLERVRAIVANQLINNEQFATMNSRLSEAIVKLQTLAQMSGQASEPAQKNGRGDLHGPQRMHDVVAISSFRNPVGNPNSSTAPEDCAW